MMKKTVYQWWAACLPIGLGIVLLSAVLWLPVPGFASSDLKDVGIPTALYPSFKHLISLTGPDKGGEFRSTDVNEILEFVMAPKKTGARYHTQGLFDAASAYYEFIFEKDLAHVLELSYNPKMPSHLMGPSSMRLSYWSQFGDRRQQMPNLSELLGDLEKPVIVTGREVVENTPDENTGAYYRYNLDRTLILMKHNGNNVLISLSKQVGASDVGKKGVVLGDDSDWNYLYSDKKGLTKKGLGWVRSYMYDSASIVVYYETKGATPQVKYGAFKWLNAGWQLINMVKTHHIHKGLLRYSQAYKSIIENPNLEDSSILADTFAGINGMPVEELQQRYLDFLKAMREKYAENPLLRKKWIAGLLNDGQIEKMDPREIRAALMLDSFKRLLGKDCLLSYKL